MKLKWYKIGISEIKMPEKKNERLVGRSQMEAHPITNKTKIDRNHVGRA